MLSISLTVLCNLQRMLPHTTAAGPKIADYYKILYENSELAGRVKSLSKEIETFSATFPILPGIEDL